MEQARGSTLSTKKKTRNECFLILFVVVVVAVLGFELRAYPLSHSTSSFFVC
jgi:hypothetical protein